MKVLTKLGWQDIPATKETDSYKITLDNGDSFQVNGDAEMWVVTNYISSIHVKRDHDLVKVSELQVGQRLISGTRKTSIAYDYYQRDAEYDFFTKDTHQIYNLMVGNKLTIKAKAYTCENTETEFKVRKDELIKAGRLYLYNKDYVKGYIPVEGNYKHSHIYFRTRYAIKQIFRNLPDSPTQADLKKVFSNMDNAWMIKVISLMLLGLMSSNNYLDFKPIENSKTAYNAFVFPFNVKANSFKCVNILLECMKYICNFDDGALEIATEDDNGYVHINVTIKGITNISKFLLAIGMKGYYSPYSGVSPIVCSFDYYTHNYISYPIDDPELCKFVNFGRSSKGLSWYPEITRIEQLDVNEDTYAGDSDKKTPIVPIDELEIGNEFGCPEYYIMESHADGDCIHKKLINGYWGNF